MAEGPTGVWVDCPRCDGDLLAIIPLNSTLVDDDTDSDGKVWARCNECREQCLLYFQFSD